jgi:DeoR/GlpR family transcriptional regulator of sugar metabolism
MLAEQRQSHILELMRRDGAVRVTDLVHSLGVSDMTIRRDLKLLAEAGLVQKVHGGATLVTDSAVFEPSFAAKSTLQRLEKREIARAGAALVAPGTAIGMSAGTTTHSLAAELLDVAGLTVVTNSYHIADLFYQHGRPDQTILLTGGVRTPSDAYVGAFAVDALRSVHVDLVFMGVHGMTAESGFTTPNLLEAEANRALIDSGRRLVVVADHTKWGVVGISSIARLDEAHVLISDAGLAPDAVAALREDVGELILADVESSDRTIG